VSTLPHRVDVKAQNTQVAQLCARQFLELTLGKLDALGGGGASLWCQLSEVASTLIFDRTLPQVSSPFERST
jgi:hypothetical protein